jgi:L-seryl-tRNA(Ser) seleniumtransferase
LLQLPATQTLIERFGRELTVEALRSVLDERRRAVLKGSGATADEDSLAAEAAGWLAAVLEPTLRPVINATGIIVHTNLGRAPLSEAALEAVAAVAAGYSTLEYDLEDGKRGSRAVHAEQLLQRLTGAEAALTVNNNAAAILLMLSALCRGREVIISRGQLVEIGGGFRIPDVLAQSGATLVEVGTTNRTHLRDYAEAITDNTAAILVAHYSNYQIIGFTSQPSLAELSELAQGAGLPLLYDQGSGALVDVSPYGLEPEPTVLDGLAAGCDIVAFSGDKLLGGPQAGILCGRESLIDQLKRHPLARAVRADKLCLAALKATLLHYVSGQAMDKVPVLRMIARTPAELAQTADRWQTRLQRADAAITIIPGESRVGGGSLPGTSLPSHLLAINSAVGRPDELAERLRAQPTPVIGRVQDGLFLLDPRTVLPHQEETLLNAVSAVLAQG